MSVKSRSIQALYEIYILLNLNDSSFENKYTCQFKCILLLLTMLSLKWKKETKSTRKNILKRRKNKWQSTRVLTNDYDDYVPEW